jgi:hypothetical protein
LFQKGAEACLDHEMVKFHVVQVSLTNIDSFTAIQHVGVGLTTIVLEDCNNAIFSIGKDVGKIALPVDVGSQDGLVIIDGDVGIAHRPIFIFIGTILPSVKEESHD